MFRIVLISGLAFGLMAGSTPDARAQSKGGAKSPPAKTMGLQKQQQTLKSRPSGGNVSSGTWSGRVKEAPKGGNINSSSWGRVRDENRPGLVGNSDAGMRGNQMSRQRLNQGNDADNLAPGQPGQQFAPRGWGGTMAPPPDRSNIGLEQDGDADTLAGARSRGNNIGLEQDGVRDRPPPPAR